SPRSIRTTARPATSSVTCAAWRGSSCPRRASSDGSARLVLGLEREDLRAQRFALGLVDHRDVAREAERRGEHVTATGAPRLARRAVLLDVVEQGAELAQLVARHTRAVADDHA